MNTDLKNDDRRERVARAIARDENGDETGWQAWLNEADAVLADLGLTQAEPAQLQLRDRPPGATRPWSKWHAYDSRAERNHAAEDRKKHGWQVETRDLYTAPQPQAQAATCPACEGTPQDENNPCHVCGAVATQQPQPRPQASAEDVALVGLAIKEHAARYPGCETENAWQRIRASMEVGRE
jgi:hypothetical protein